MLLSMAFDDLRGHCSLMNRSLPPIILAADASQRIPDTSSVAVQFARDQNVPYVEVDPQCPFELLYQAMSFAIPFDDGSPSVSLYTLANSSQLRIETGLMSHLVAHREVTRLTYYQRHLTAHSGYLIGGVLATNPTLSSLALSCTTTPSFFSSCISVSTLGVLALADVWCVG